MQEIKKVLLTEATDEEFKQVFKMRFKKGKFCKIKRWEDFKKFLLLSHEQENKVIEMLRKKHPDRVYEFTDKDRDYLILGPSGSSFKADIVSYDKNGKSVLFPEYIEVKNCTARQFASSFICFNEHWELNKALPDIEQDYKAQRLHNANVIYFVSEDCKYYSKCDLDYTQEFWGKVGMDGKVNFFFYHTSWEEF